MFYEFRQNNSGGSFTVDQERGISRSVIIEATDHIHANYLAGRLGIYFDGVDQGNDCSCCGDRWYKVSEGDGCEVPAHYRIPLVDAETFFLAFLEEGTPPLYVHLLDGMVFPFHVHEKRFVYLGADLPVGILGEES